MTNENPLQAIKEFSQRFIVLPKESDYNAITLWIAHTYFTDILTTTPRLGFLSPEYGCGKSRCLEVISALSFQSVSLGSTTKAYLMRKTNQVRQEFGRPPTILIDEVDTVWNGSATSDSSEALRQIVNLGYKQNATIGVVDEVVREVAGKKIKSREPVDFAVFAPLAYAGKGDKAPQSVKSRSIEIRLQKRISSEKIEDFLTKAVKFQVSELCEWLTNWADESRQEIEWENVVLPNNFQDRDRELLLPLYAVARLANWEEEFASIASTFATQRVNEEISNDRQILSDCLDVFHFQGSSDRISSKELTKGLNGLEEASYRHWNKERGINEKNLSRSLRLYGIEPSQIRFGDKTLKGYYRQTIEVAHSRYSLEESGVSQNKEETNETEETRQEQESFF